MHHEQPARSGDPRQDPPSRTSASNQLTASELLGGCALHEVVRGTWSRTADRVVVKRARRGQDPLAARRSIDHERRVLGQLAGVDGVPQVLGGGSNEIVMVDLGANDLARSGLAGRVDAAGVLEVAHRLARTLAAIHARGVAHLDVHPGNVVVRADDLAVELIDYSCATPLPLSDLDDVAASQQVPHLGAAGFRAPELDGSGWDGVDHRADLYGLGATLLYLVSGSTPFVEEDPVELRHAKRTRFPAVLDELGEQLPELFVRILRRLVDPDPDGRYRGAAGLVHDLETLRSSLRAGMVAADLPLGRRDLAPAPRAPRRLVGRSTELTELRAALDDARRGGCHAVFVAGPPGIGKTALVSELRADVLASGGRFVAGKFDELQRDQPLSAPISCLRELTRQLLDGPEGQAAGWRRRLTDAVGVDARVITDAVPDLRALLEVRAAPEADDPLERRSRLRSGLTDLLAAVAHRDAPLVLVLDDLQWADHASVELLGQLLTTPQLDGLLVIGAYRDAEVAPSDPMSTLLVRLRCGGHAPRELLLGPLQPAMLAELVSAMLLDELAEDEELVRIVAARSAGNPFHAVELVLGLHLRGALVADPARARWTLVPQRLADEALSDDLVTMLVDELTV